MATVRKLLITAIRDVRITSRQSWYCPFRGHSIITPSLGYNWIIEWYHICNGHSDGNFQIVFHHNCLCLNALALMNQLAFAVVDFITTCGEKWPDRSQSKYGWCTFKTVFGCYILQTLVSSRAIFASRACSIGRPIFENIPAYEK